MAWFRRSKSVNSLLYLPVMIAVVNKACDFKLTHRNMKTIFTILIIFAIFILLMFINWLRKNSEPDEIGIMDLNE